MPWKPKRPCRHPGCPNLSDQSYCEAHRKGAAADSNRVYDESRRDREMKEFYNSPAWRSLRELKLKRNPVCEECYRKGRISKAAIADHVLPAREYPSKRLDIDNLQSLCRGCHNKKTAAERGQGESNL